MHWEFRQFYIVDPQNPRSYGDTNFIEFSILISPSFLTRTISPTPLHGTINVVWVVTYSNQSLNLGSSGGPFESLQLETIVKVFVEIDSWS